MACTNPKEIFNGFDVPIQVPCGHCRACRLARVASWTFRLTAELPYWDSSAFITFTYDDDNYFRLDTDYSLQHSDIQKFMKRLRKNIPGEYKYFVCGEYGGETYRCHYHMILYGFWPDDSIKDNFSNLYHSETLSKLWPHGDVSFGIVTPDSCAYVAGYVNKKLGSTSTGVYAGVRPPYVAVSGGIGLRYCLENATQLRRDMCVFMPDGTRLPLPKYYKNKLGLTTEEKYANYLKNMESMYNISKRNGESLSKKIKSLLSQKATDLTKLEKISSNTRDNIVE